jgi:hypothetical protein
VVIGVLCGLLISESDRKSPFVAPKPNAQPKTGTVAPAFQPAAGPPTGPAAKPAKPSPAIAAAAIQPEQPAQPKESADRAPNRTPAYTPATFQATHKKVFGGCTGELVLTSAALLFRCPKQADLDVPIGEIAGANKDGVLLKSGEKYHFAIANRTKDQAEAIFITWLSKVQPPSQQGSAF